MVGNEDDNQNLESGARLTLSSPIPGVDAVAYVQFDGITGGAASESNESLLSRTLQSRSNPVGILIEIFQQ